MEKILSTATVFRKGSDQRFHKAVEAVDLSKINFMTKKTLVQQDHRDGAPNSSFPSTADGSLMAAHAIMCSMGKNGTYPFERHLFGNRIRKGMNIVREFCEEFVKK
jgi:hypothetical protein